MTSGSRPTMHDHADRLTIDRMLTQSAQRWPNKAALATFDAEMTYAAMERASCQMARLLLAMGAGPKSRIAVILANSIEFNVALYAISRVGAVLIPVNPAFTDRELLHVLNDAAAELVVARRKHVERLRDDRGAVPSLRDCVAVESLDELLALLEGHSDAPINSPLGSASIHSILYTSGTTGSPKGAVLTHRARIVNSMACRLGYEVNAETRLNCPVPTFHSGGMVLGCINVIAAGGTLIIPRDPSPESSIHSVNRLGANYLLLVPTLILRIVENDAFQEAARHHPITMLHGAAPMPTALAERLFREFPMCRPIHAYGTTEAPQLTALAKEEYRTHPSATGRPLPGTDVWVADEAGAPVSPGKIGEIVTAGPHVFEGYLNAPEQTASVLRDGIYHTGDLAKVGNDGIITIVGRTRDMIISGGLNIYAKEVEDVLHQHREILQASVFSLPDPEWGEAVSAAIVPKAGASLEAEAIVDFCRQRLASYKKPRHVFFVDALPLTPAGKVQKFKLAERFSAKHGA
ncbi:MAG: acyl--CoA ligase [Rhodospirillaceae bacterium]|nr:acyl--CoA ligase [Rhodospirillaceae bacterium]